MTADFAFVRAISQPPWPSSLGDLAPPYQCSDGDQILSEQCSGDDGQNRSGAPSGNALPVETALEEGKSELGMDHYETRTWRGWHHQMTLTFLAHHFLVRLRLKMKKSLRP